METRDVIDHDKLIDDNTATEYSESTVPEYTKALNFGHTELDGVYNDLVNRLSIPDAIGDGLDTIGAITGQPRIVVSASAIVFFGFQGIVESNSFGDADDASLGGRFREDGEDITGNTHLIDSDYRTVISSRIIKNHTHSTPEEVIEALNILLGQENIILQDGVTTATGTIIFTSFITANQRAQLLSGGLVPKTAGVKYDYKEVNDPFGFFGHPLVSGFGDINDLPITGGSFPRDIT